MNNPFEREHYGKVVSIEDNLLSLEQYIEVLQPKAELIPAMNAASVVFVPAGIPYNPAAFPVGILDFYQYCKQAMGDDIAYCSTPNMQTIELCSSQLRLGKFLVKDVALPIFLGLIVNYTSYKMQNHVESEPAKIETQYLEEPSVSFTVTVVDSADVKSKTYSYEGPVSGIQEAGNTVEKLWQDEKRKGNTK